MADAYSAHRYITEVIFASGHVGDGHWCRFHRFFSHAAWDIDSFSMCLAKAVITILAPGAVLLWAVDDTLCRKRGLTLYGAGMHYDPLISSRAKSLVSWGHDWVVLTLIVAFPIWAPTKVFALPIAMRLYRNRQGLTKGKRGPKGKGGRRRAPKPKHDPSHRTRPELALELIELAARWFPDDEIILTGDSAYGGRSILSQLPPNVHLISHVHPKGALYRPAPPKPQGAGPQEGGPLARHEGMGRGSRGALDSTGVRPVRAACHLGRQDAAGPLLQGGQGSAPDDRPGARCAREAPRSDVLLHQAGLDGTADPLGLCLSLGD
jgi:hypothetical protein